MALTSRLPLLVITVFALLVSSSAQNCSVYSFWNNRTYESCIDLQVLSAHLHWNYIPSTKTVDIAYIANQLSTGWIAWGINPTSTGMVGTQALVAFRNPNATMNVFTTNVSSYSPTMQPEKIGFEVSNISATYANNEMIILAVIGPLGNRTRVNHVWQAGPLSDGSPAIHPMARPNAESMGTIVFLT